MPRDDWAKYNARDCGRRAIRSGEYDKLVAEPKPVNRSIYARQREVREANAAEQCKHCKKVAIPKLSERVFKDGTKHIEAKCPHCDKHIKWMGN